MLFRYPWFRKFKPDIDWKKSKLQGPPVQIETLLHRTLQHAKTWIKSKKEETKTLSSRHNKPDVHHSWELLRAKLAPTRNAFPNNPRTHSTITSRSLTAPNPSSNQVISRTHDRGNLSHDPSCDLPVPNVSCDLTARDPGNVAHDQPRNWSSSTSQDHIRFGHTTCPLINTWKTVGRIHKHVTVDQSTKMRLIGVTPQ